MSVRAAVRPHATARPQTSYRRESVASGIPTALLVLLLVLPGASAAGVLLMPRPVLLLAEPASPSSAPDGGRALSTTWEQEQSNGERTGTTSVVVPLLSDDIPPLWQVPLPGVAIGQPLVQQQRVLASRSSGYSVALNQSTGEQDWLSTGTSVAGTGYLHGTDWWTLPANGTLTARDLASGLVSSATALNGSGAGPLAGDATDLALRSNTRNVTLRDLSVVAPETWGATLPSDGDGPLVVTASGGTAGLVLAAAGGSVHALDRIDGSLEATLTPGGSGDAVLAMMVYGYEAIVLRNDGEVARTDLTTFLGNSNQTALEVTGALALATGVGGIDVAVIGTNDSVELLRIDDASLDGVRSIPIDGPVRGIVTNGSEAVVAADSGLFVLSLQTGAVLWRTHDGPVRSPLLCDGRIFALLDEDIVAYGSRPSVALAATTPLQVSHGAELALEGNLTSGDAIGFRWSSDVDGILTQGSMANSTVLASLSEGFHNVTLQAQDANFSWSDPADLGARIQVEVLPPAQWIAQGRDHLRTSGGDIAPPVAGTIKWVHDGDAPSFSEVVSSPVIDGNTIYYSDALDGRTFAVDRTSGQRRWVYQPSLDSASGSPTIYRGDLIIPRGDTKVHRVFVNEFGDPEERWATDLPTPIAGSPTVVGERVLVTTFSDQAIQNPKAGKVFALNTNGQILWNWSMVDPSKSPRTAPAVAQGLVVVGTDDDQVVALHLQNGTVAWQTPILGDSFGSPLIAEGLVFIGSDIGRFYALNLQDGGIAWTKDLPSGARIIAAPAYGNGTVVVVGEDGAAYAWNAASGTARWNVTLPQGSVTQPLVLRNTVILASVGGTVATFDLSNGTAGWSTDIGGGITARAMAAADTEIYVGSSSQRLVAIGQSPDLAVVRLTVNQPVVVKAPTTIEVDVTNLGSLAATAELSVLLGATELERPDVSVAPGAHQLFVIDWTPQAPGDSIIRAELFNTSPTDYLPGNDAMQVSVSVTPGGFGWRMFRGTPDHTAFSSVPTPANNQLGVGYPIALSVPTTSSPVVADDLIYIGTGSKLQSVHDPTATPFVSRATAGLTTTTPAVVGGRVFFTSSDNVLHAVGSQQLDSLWDLPMPVSQSAPTVSGSRLFIGTAEGRLLAVDTTSGAVLLNISVGERIDSTPAYTNGLVVVGAKTAEGGGIIAAYNSTGAKVWQFTTSSPVSASAAISDNVVYTASEGGRVFALELVGDSTDDGQTDPPEAVGVDLIWNSTPIEGGGILSSPAVGEGLVVLGVGTSNVVALFATDPEEGGQAGDVAWNTSLPPAAEPIVSSPAIGGGKVYIGGAGFHALDLLTGARLWDYTALSDLVVSSPALLNNAVYVASRDGQLLKFSNLTYLPPTAVIATTPRGTSFTAGLPVTFDGSGSTDDGVIRTYTWTLERVDSNASQPQLPSTPSVAVTFEEPGRYRLILTVTDNEKVIPPLQGTTELEFTIREDAAPLLSALALSPADGIIEAGQNVTVTVVYHDIDNQLPSSIVAQVGGFTVPLPPIDAADLTVSDNNTRFSGVISGLPSGRFPLDIVASDGVKEVTLASAVPVTVWQQIEISEGLNLLVRVRLVGTVEVLVEPTESAEQLAPPTGRAAVTYYTIQLDPVAEVVELGYIEVRYNYTSVLDRTGQFGLANANALRVYRYDRVGLSWVGPDIALDDRTNHWAISRLTPTILEVKGSDYLPLLVSVQGPALPTVGPQPLVDLRADRSSHTMVVGQTITLTAQVRWDDNSNQTPVTYRWSVDTTPRNVTGGTFEFSSKKPGVFTIHVRIIDANNRTADDELTVTVQSENTTSVMVLVAILAVGALVVIILLPERPEDEESLPIKPARTRLPTAEVAPEAAAIEEEQLGSGTDAEE